MMTMVMMRRRRMRKFCLFVYPPTPPCPCFLVVADGDPYGEEDKPVCCTCPAREALPCSSGVRLRPRKGKLTSPQESERRCSGGRALGAAVFRAFGSGSSGTCETLPLNSVVRSLGVCDVEVVANRNKEPSCTFKKQSLKPSSQTSRLQKQTLRTRNRRPQDPKSPD